MTPTADEGTTHTYTYTVTDPGDDTLTIVESCGANGVLTDTAAVTASTAPSPTDRPSTVSVSANDEDPGPHPWTRSPSPSPTSSRPSVLTGATTANEGDTKTYTYTVTDPGDDTLTVVESCGANGVYAADAAVNSFMCTFPDGPATSTVKVTANDEDPGPASEATRLVTIANVKPVVTFAAIAVDPVTGVISSTMTYADVGVNDTQTATFEYRLNGVLVATHTSASTLPSSGTALDSYTAAPGCYTVEVTMWVTDKDGASSDHAVRNGFTPLVDIYTPSFKAPIKNNERNIAKYGNVVPIKVELASNCSPGTTVTSPVLHITIALGNVADVVPDATPVIVAESVSNADTGTQMRVNGGRLHLQLHHQEPDPGPGLHDPHPRRQYDRTDHPAGLVPAQEVTNSAH